MIQSPEQLQHLLERHKGQHYILDYSRQSFKPPYVGAPSVNSHLPACLEHGADSCVILEAIVQAALFRKFFNRADILARLELIPAGVQNEVEINNRHILHKDNDWQVEQFHEEVRAVHRSIQEECSYEQHTPLQGVEGVRWSYSHLDEATGSRALVLAAKLAAMAVPTFVSDLKNAGWNIQPMKLSTKERNGYIIIHPSHE
jgi:hypothetical protein